MSEKPPFASQITLYCIGALIVAFIGWAMVAQVDEIARGQGRVIPVSRTQVIQTSEAGIVQEIAVKLGQVVRKGDLLVRLDDTSTSSSLGENLAKARALEVKLLRLTLEEESRFDTPLECPKEIAETAPGICENEQRLLDARRDNYQSKLSVLIERRLQRERELEEALTSITAIEKNLAVARQEKELIEPIAKKGLVAQTELLRVNRSVTELEGQLAVARDSVPRLEAAINEARLQVEELKVQLQQEALDEKTQVLAELSVVRETIRGASDRVARTDIRSPVDGVVNTLDVNTIGGYVQPGTVVAGIVPTAETLLVEARISPRDVAFVRTGQPALVKFTAYDFSIYGGLNGDVVNVSADSLVDQNTGETYYEVRVATETSELVKNGQAHPIIPGMVTTVEIMTGRKTVLDYLLKPVNKARAEALTER